MTLDQLGHAGRPSSSAFETRMSDGPGDMVATGAVRGGQAGDRHHDARPAPQSQTIPWQAEWGGLFAAEQSLRQQPLKPGEKRTVRGLMPMLNIAGDDRTGRRPTMRRSSCPPASRSCSRSNSVIDLAGRRSNRLLWVNEQGETLKSLVPTHRAGSASARRRKTPCGSPAGGQFDLLVASTVPLKGDASQSAEDEARRLSGPA